MLQRGKMLYKIKNGTVEFGAEIILRKINIEINAGEKIAIVGRNGCGKTTLLRLIAGEIELSKNEYEDSVIAKNGKVEIGYLKQNAFSELDITLDDELKKCFEPLLRKQARINELLDQLDSGDEAKINEFTRLSEEFENDGGYYYEKEYNAILSAFGFSLEDKKRKLSEFSGGQLTKIAFVKLLLSKPDILLLDEPTNHLDISTVEWLEGYLKEYKRAVVIVSHDRMFLDKIAEKVYEIEHGISRKYAGNYSAFIKQKEDNYERELKAYRAQQDEIARLTELIEKFKNTPTKVAMTRSKLKQIEHMEKLEEPMRFDTGTFKAKFKPNRDTGKEILAVSHLKIGYGKELCEISFKQYKRQRVAVIGTNGTGKSTFLKTLVGAIPKISGDFDFGHQVDVGYFDQQMTRYQSNKTVLDEFWDEFPSLTQTEARGALGAFMFTQDDVFKTVDMLSGGEKVRLALCKILQRKPNFLILDEPTNHMDIIGKDTLEKMLIGFEGSVLFVSHDRYFVRSIADSLLIFNGHSVEHFPYGYDEYLEKKQTLPEQNEEKTAEPEIIKEGKQSYMLSKERSRLERKLQRTKAKIEDLEKSLETKRAELELPENASDYMKLCELGEQIENDELSILSLMEECEDMENQLK